jgi:hypothetical protein
MPSTVEDLGEALGASSPPGRPGDCRKETGHKTPIATARGLHAVAECPERQER